MERLKKPQWLKDLEDSGLTEAELSEARKAYTEVGLDLARVPHRGWRVFGLHKTKPVTFVLWSGLDLLVGNRQEIIERFLELEASA